MNQSDHVQMDLVQAKRHAKNLVSLLEDNKHGLSSWWAFIVYAVDGINKNMPIREKNE